MTAVDSEQSLLFGILALQEGLIEPSDFMAAFLCLQKDPTRSMAQILIERGVLSEQDRTMLEGLILRHSLRDGGGSESSPAELGPPAARLGQLLEEAGADRLSADRLSTIDF